MPNPERAILSGAIVAAGFVVGFVAGCVAPRDESSHGAGNTARPDTELVTRSVPADDAGTEAPERLTVFAAESFYLERPEPEQTFRGVLRRVEVRLGPNTRDMPLRLDLGGEQLAVYVSGFDLEALGAYVDRPVEVTGKRVDLSPEEAGFEIWIGSLAPARP